LFHLAFFLDFWNRTVLYNPAETPAHAYLNAGRYAIVHLRAFSCPWSLLRVLYCILQRVPIVAYCLQLGWWSVRELHPELWDVSPRHDCINPSAAASYLPPHEGEKIKWRYYAHGRIEDVGAAFRSCTGASGKVDRLPARHIRPWCYQRHGQPN